MALVKSLLSPTSVADPDVYPGSRILIFTSIPDHGSRIQKQQQKRGVKKLLSYRTFFYSHKFHKTENYLIFEMLKKKIWASFQRIIELFTKNLSLSSQKYGFRIRDPSLGVKKAPDPGSGSATLSPTQNLPEFACHSPPPPPATCNTGYRSDVMFESTDGAGCQFTRFYV
jgi:hypothetical protein